MKDSINLERLGSIDSDMTVEAELMRSLGVVAGVTGKVIDELLHLTWMRRSPALTAETGASYCGRTIGPSCEGVG